MTSTESVRRWRARHPEDALRISRESNARARRRHPDRTKARTALNHAIERKGFKRLPCEVCGEPKSEAHHEDYSKPLEVRWLCRAHRVEVENAKRAAA